LSFESRVYHVIDFFIPNQSLCFSDRAYTV
jgi:hypothetical protein